MNNAASTSRAEDQPAWANHTVFRSSLFARTRGQSDHVRPQFQKNLILMAESVPDPSFPSRSSVQIHRFPVSRQFTGFHGESDRVRLQISQNSVLPVAEFLVSPFSPLSPVQIPSPIVNRSSKIP